MTEAIPPEIMAELWEYPRKRTPLAYLLWLTLGIFGAHRIYLGRVWTGILMLLTGGGALVWWLVDAFLLRGMVKAHNHTQAERKRLGLPPLALDFMPVSDGSELARRPEWDEPRSRTTRKIVLGAAADGLVVVTAGFALGSVSRAAGNVEAITAVVALILVLNFGRQLAPLHHVPLIGDLVRWGYRLRLFYHHNRPGRALSRLVRPLVGFLYAPFHKKSRAEVGLYVRLGGAFVVLFLLEDLATEVARPIVVRGDLSGLTGGWWFKDVFLTLVIIYAFAVPIGATLMLHLLTRRSATVWLLSALATAALVAGAFGV